MRDKNETKQDKPSTTRGRPLEKLYPQRIDASPEEIAEMVLRMPPKKRGEWRYEQDKEGS